MLKKIYSFCDGNDISLCVGIVSVYSLQGASSSVLQTISGSLLAAFDPSEVITLSSLQSCVDAFSAVGELANSGYLATLPTSTITTIASTISNFVLKAATVSDSTLNSLGDPNFVNTVVDQFVSGVLQVIVNGEPPTRLITDYFQALISRADISTLAGLDLSPPKTTIQSSYASSSPVIKLTSAGIAAAGFTSQYAKFAMIAFTLNPNPTSTSSNTPLVKFLSFSSSSRNLAASFRRSKVSFTPAFYVTIPFSTVQNFNFSQDITLSSYNKLNRKYQLPVCMIYNPSLGQSLPCGTCNISVYNNYNVTFGCQDISLVFSSSTSRRLPEDSLGLVGEVDAGNRELISDDSVSSDSSGGNQFSAMIDVYVAPTSSPTSFPTGALLLPRIVNINAYGFSRTAIRASVSLSAKVVSTSGFLYCIASLNSTMNSLTFLRTYGVATSFKNMSQTLLVQMSNLNPSQTYFVYCGITTSKGYASSSRKIMANRVTAKTLCCRIVSFTTTPSFVYGDLSRYNSLIFNHALVSYTCM